MKSTKDMVQSAIRGVLEKLLPDKYWEKPPLKPEEFWSALASTGADNPTYRALMHEAVDRFVTQMQAAESCPPDDAKRNEHLSRAWEMADYIRRIEEYRERAPEEVKRRALG